MTRKPKISRAFCRFNPQDKVTFGNNTVTTLSGQTATFPNFPVPLIDLTAANNDLNAKYNAFKLYGKSHKQALMESESIWITKWNQTVDYIEVVANGVGSVLELSGIPLTKTTIDPIEPCLKPEANLYIGDTKGTVRAKTKTVKNAKGYFYAVGTSDFEVQKNGNQYTLKLGNSFVSFIISTQKEVVFTSLPSHIDVQGAVAAFNTAGLGEFMGDLGVSIP